MNLSPAWVPVLQAVELEAVHWSSVGAATAPDEAILDWAREEGFVLVTNDLDFSAILAATRAAGPSVIQIRGQDLNPDALAPTLIEVARERASELAVGAIMTIDLHRARVRMLPLV